ncbi:MAG: hypothetical protein II493_03070 [Spirochaetales bacterium]|nr:hypothetical protein [Spirochaetales bacterium]MBQ5365637.1 hypothetical protein [Spirochaetales bacterium]
MLHDFGDVLRGIMIMDAEYESVFNFLAEVLEPLLKRQADEFTTDL